MDFIVVYSEYKKSGKSLTFLIILRIVRPTKSGAKAKICQFDVAVLSDENVIRLDVAMDESHLVYAFYR